MKKIILSGKRPLSGRVEISGSKNAALPIIFASVITRGVSIIENAPDIGDVSVALRLIEMLGAKSERIGSTLHIDTRNMHYSAPDRALMAEIRASTYLLGAELSRFGIFEYADFGGCSFSPRPIDMHITAARAFGAEERGGFLLADRLLGCELNFDKVSVGATVNSLIMAAAADGTTVIRGGAREPHVLCLVDYLRSAGAYIDVSDGVFTVTGGELSGGRVRVIGDMIEAGTYLAAGLITDGEVTVSGICPDELFSFLPVLYGLGADISTERSELTVRRRGQGAGLALRAEPYPGFPTDLQPIAAPLMAFSAGGVIVDRVWRGRFGYLSALARQGVISRSLEGCAIIGKSKIKKAAVTAPDLRGGAASLLCALAADGESEINNAEIIYRGYERIEEKLSSLGADIKL